MYSHPEEDSIPVLHAVTHPNLRFSQFIATFSLEDFGDEASVWRLGAALFDELELDLGEEQPAIGSDPSMSSYISGLRRRAALSNWLETISRIQVNRDIQEARHFTQSILAHLSGHQIDLACDAALSGKDYRLATLLPQVGGDVEFQEDIRLQLKKWSEPPRVDNFISKDHRKIYEILSGNVVKIPSPTSSTSPDIFICENLDWKRVFGLHLWYGSPQHHLRTAVDNYFESSQNYTASAAPLPAYLAITPRAPQWSSVKTPAFDATFEMIKLSYDDQITLEGTLLPRGFSASPLDFRLPWHMYTLIASVLRIRAFVDIEDPRHSLNDEEVLRLTSPTADSLTLSYAHHLEVIGLWQWSAFILQHLPSGTR